MTPSAQAAVTPVPTRRARQRAATTGEIKALARRQLAEQGPRGLSLRAIARQMGTAPSAPYRYFPSQSHLITELCARADRSLLGSLVTEIFGSMTALISDTDMLYHAHVRTVTLGIGFQPALLNHLAADTAG